MKFEYIKSSGMFLCIYKSTDLFYPKILMKWLYQSQAVTCKITHP